MLGSLLDAKNSSIQFFSKQLNQNTTALNHKPQAKLNG